MEVRHSSYMQNLFLDPIALHFLNLETSAARLARALLVLTIHTQPAVAKDRNLGPTAVLIQITGTSHTHQRCCTYVLACCDALCAIGVKRDTLRMRANSTRTSASATVDPELWLMSKTKSKLNNSDLSHRTRPTTWDSRQLCSADVSGVSTDQSRKSTLTFVPATGGKPRLILDQDKRTTGGLVQGYVLKVQLQIDKQLNQKHIWTWKLT